MKQVSNLKQPPLWLPSNTIIHRIFPPSSSSLWPSDWMHSSDATWEADASSSIIYLFILFFNRLMTGTLCSSFPLIFHQLQVPRFRSGTIFLAGRFRVAVEINHRLLSIIDWTPLMLRQFWLRRPAELMSQVHQMCSCATQTTLCRGRKKKKRAEVVSWWRKSPNSGIECGGSVARRLFPITCTCYVLSHVSGGSSAHHLSRPHVTILESRGCLSL